MSTEAQKHIDAGVALFNKGQAGAALKAFSSALARGGGANALFFRAMAWESRDNPKKALADIKAGLKLEPRNHGMRVKAAGLLRAAGRRKEAVAELKTVLRAAPDHAGALALSARVHSEIKNPALALKHMRAALSAEPRSAALRAEAAELYAGLGDAGAALEECAQGLLLAPDSAELRLLAARIEESAGRPEAALERVEAGLKRFPESVEFHMRRTQLLSALGRAEEAARAGAEVERLCPGGMPPEFRVEVLAAAGRYAEAVELLGKLSKGEKSAAPLKRALLAKQKASKGLGTPAGMLKLKAAFMLQQEHREDEALALVEEALALEPKSANAHMRRAELLAVVGRIPESWKALAKALELDKKSPAVRFAAGQFCQEQGEYAAAERHLRAAVAADKGFSRAWAQSAKLAAWRGRWSEALKLAGKALSCREAEAPEKVIALRAKAAALAMTGKTAAAFAALGDLFELAPGDAEGLAWKAELLREDGRAAEAEKALAESALSAPDALSLAVNRSLLRLEAGAAPTMADEQAASGMIPPDIVPLRGIASMADVKDWMARLKKARRAMAGNLSRAQTFVWRGRLVDHVHYYPRNYPSQLQRRIRFGDAGRVLGEFKRIMRETPNEAYLHSHRGEVFLWLGRYEEALADFEAAGRLNEALLWPKIGKGAVWMLTGKPEKTLEQMDYASGHGGSIPIMMPWRGESQRLLGDFSGALETFSQMRMAFPFRPSIWLNLALTKAALGDHVGAAELFFRLKESLPEFMADAAAQEGLDPAKPRDSWTAKETEKVLSRALALMRGNRSSWMYTYVLPDGRLKIARVRASRPEDVPPNLAGARWALIDPGR